MVTLSCLLLLHTYIYIQHALQASKTDDAELKDSIRQAKNAIEAKKIARVVKVMTTVSCCPP